MREGILRLGEAVRHSGEATVARMREVPAKLFGFMREMSRRAGADVDRAQAGLALRAVDVDAPGERMDWDEVAIFLERAHGHLPPDRMEAIGETYVQTHVWQQLMARVIGSPRLICEVCFGPLTQAAFPHMRVVLEPTDAGVRWELTLPDRFAPSPFFFRATAGEARALTTLVGRPPAHVEADVGPRHGRYRSRSTSRRGRWIARCERRVTGPIGWSWRASA